MGEETRYRIINRKTAEVCEAEGKNGLKALRPIFRSWLVAGNNCILAQIVDLDDGSTTPVQLDWTKIWRFRLNPDKDGWVQAGQRFGGVLGGKEGRGNAKKDD